MYLYLSSVISLYRDKRFITNLFRDKIFILLKSKMCIYFETTEVYTCMGIELDLSIILWRFEALTCGWPMPWSKYPTNLSC